MMVLGKDLKMCHRTKVYRDGLTIMGAGTFPGGLLAYSPTWAGPAQCQVGQSLAMSAKAVPQSSGAQCPGLAKVILWVGHAQYGTDWAGRLTVPFSLP